MNDDFDYNHFDLFLYKNDLIIFRKNGILLWSNWCFFMRVKRCFLRWHRSFSFDILSQSALHGIGHDGLDVDGCSDSVELELIFNSEFSFELTVSDKFLFMNWLSFIFCGIGNLLIQFVGIIGVLLNVIVDEWRNSNEV